MKPLSFSVVVIATSLLEVCAAFSSNNSAHVSPRPQSQQTIVSQKNALTAPLQKYTYYYWYTVPGDTYNDYNDVYDEEGELEVELQAVVDTDPYGGTEVMAGYINDQYPHLIWPSVLLYAHYNN